MTTTTTDKTVTIDPRALTVISAMQDKVCTLARFYGEGSPQHSKAAASMASVLSRIMLAGFSDQARVYRDDDLSLYVVDGTFHYGVIFFRDKRACTTEGCGAFLTSEGRTTYIPYGATTPCEDGTHVPDFPYHAPEAGTWSTHS